MTEDHPEPRPRLGLEPDAVLPRPGPFREDLGRVDRAECRLCPAAGAEHRTFDPLHLETRGRATFAGRGIIKEIDVEARQRAGGPEVDREPVRPPAARPARPALAGLERLAQGILDVVPREGERRRGRHHLASHTLVVDMAWIIRGSIRDEP